MSAKAPVWTRLPWRRIGLGFVLWTAWVLLASIQDYASLQFHGKPLPWPNLLFRCAEEWYLWAVVSLLVFQLGRRFPLDPSRLKSRIGLHLAASVIVAALYCVLLSAMLIGQTSVDGGVMEFGKTVRKFLANYLIMEVIFYWVFLLGYHSWHFFRQFREREKQAAALATALVEARLQALSMQINPHFLFNTLNAISALIHENPKAADRMVVRLSELLRRTLAQVESQEVPLRQEIEFLRGYLEIEQMRFPDRLTARIEVEPGTEDLYVPSLILQPLVENAIRHGVEPREEMGRVDITVRRSNGQLELKVRDNGPGLPDPATTSPRKGIGLSNTQSRLAHLYGASHQFTLQPAPGGGLEVELRIPCRAEAHSRRPRAFVVSGDCPLPDTAALAGLAATDATAPGRPCGT